MGIERRALVAAACAGALPALAHSSKPHSKTQQTAPPRKEQKAWGIAAEAKSAQRTIVVAMTDAMRFTPDAIEVQLDQTVRFDIRNHGRMLHEMVIGTAEELEDHAALMQKFPNMEHDEPYMAHVAVGKRGQIVWTFNRPGNFEFACLIAGHYQAGMKGRITVRTA
jgi:uncharacterized cupredoxin-like copper-binding protein